MNINDHFTQSSWLPHLYDLMTSWCLVVDVHYLPPMRRRPNMSAVEFADEVRGSHSDERLCPLRIFFVQVKAAIAIKGGLRFMDWDGFLKMYTVKQSLKDEEKRGYSDHFQKQYQKVKPSIFP